MIKFFLLLSKPVTKLEKVVINCAIYSNIYALKNSHVYLYIHIKLKLVLFALTFIKSFYIDYL